MDRIFTGSILFYNIDYEGDGVFKWFCIGRLVDIDMILKFTDNDRNHHQLGLISEILDVNRIRCEAYELGGFDRFLDYPHRISAFEFGSPFIRTGNSLGDSQKSDDLIDSE